MIYTILFLIITNGHYTNDILIGFITGINIATIFHVYRYNYHIWFLKVYTYLYSFLKYEKEYVRKSFIEIESTLSNDDLISM